MQGREGSYDNDLHMDQGLKVPLEYVQPHVLTLFHSVDSMVFRAERLPKDLCCTLLSLRDAPRAVKPRQGSSSALCNFTQTKTYTL